jgi:hypothetical protein
MNPRPFLPSRDGFAFDNTWPSEPAISLATPAGRIGIGNADRGLCGGMIFAALDYWTARVSPPGIRPAPGSPLFTYIVRRLINSWHIPVGVLTYYTWMNLPDHDRRGPAGTLAGLSRRTIENQWPRIRASIDNGQPAALGVVTMASANPFQLGRNHQVVGYAYDVDGSEVRLRVYDPNSGPADAVYIRFDAAEPATATFASNLSTGPVRGFFFNRYSPATPPGVAGPDG